MASHRPYRPALGIDKALEEIEKNKGTLYDSRVVDACLKLFAEDVKGRVGFLGLGPPTCPRPLCSLPSVDYASHG